MMGGHARGIPSWARGARVLARPGNVPGLRAPPPNPGSRAAFWRAPRTGATLWTRGSAFFLNLRAQAPSVSSTSLVPAQNIDPWVRKILESH